MNFSGYTGGRTSAFYSPECPSDQAQVASFFESADAVVYQAMMDSMCATYQAVACNDMTIAMEGLGDMAKSAWEFFKKIIDKIITFVKNTFNYIMSYIGDFESFIDKYKDKADFKEFQVSGYTYTIDSEDVDTGAISKLVDEYNTNSKKIKDWELHNLQSYINQELSKDKVSEIRGKICGTSPIKENRFVDALKKKYRSGKSSRSNFKINKSNINEYIDNFKKMKETLKDIKEDSRNVTDALQDMADFFKGMPQYEYKSSDKKEITQSKMSFDKEKGATIETDSERVEYSNEVYKKMTMYYNFCFRMTRELASVYTKAYTEKVSAAKEALSFYKDIIRTALSPFADKEEADKLKASKESVATEGIKSYLILNSDNPLTVKEQEIAYKEFRRYYTPETGWRFNDAASYNAKFKSEGNVIAFLSKMGSLDGYVDNEFRVKIREAIEKANKASKKFRFRMTNKLNSGGIFAGLNAYIYILAYRKSVPVSDTEKNNIYLESFDQMEAVADFNRYCKSLNFVAAKESSGDIIGFVRERDAYRSESTPAEIRIRAREAVAEASMNSDKYSYKLSYASESAVTSFAIHAILKNQPVQEAEIKIEQDLRETVNECHDYGVDFSDKLADIALEKYITDFKQYVNEIDVMAEAFQTGAVYLGDMVLEEVKVVNSNGQEADSSDEGFFSSIISFIKSIINKFVEAAKSMISSNEEWFEENNWKVKELTSKPELFQNISFTIIGYNAENKLFDKKYIHGVKFIYKNAIESKETIDFAKMARQMYPDMTKLSKNGDIAEGAKVFFRGSSNNVKQFTGGDAFKRFQIMANYCENYKAYVQHIQDALDSITSQMEDAESQLRDLTTESFSGTGLISEREPIQETMLSLMPWYGESGAANMVSVMERKNKNKGGNKGNNNANPAQAKQDAQGNTVNTQANGQVSNTENGEAPKPEDANKPKTDAEKQKEAEEKKAAKDAKVAAKTNAKTFFSVKVKVATAMLTIAEEQYAAYIKTIKGVVMAKGDALKKQGEEKKAAEAAKKKK